MSTFAYVGRNRQGAVKKGELSAKTRDEAVDQLRKQQVVVTSLEEKSAKGGKVNLVSGSGLNDKDLVVFTRQFGTMINAGLPLIQCLDILSTQSENKVLRETVGDVKNSVEAGSTFSDALKKHPKVFDELYTNMIHAGEVGGLLDTILTRLAKHIEKAMKLKGQIKSAMVYPTAILAWRSLSSPSSWCGSSRYLPRCSLRCRAERSACLVRLKWSSTSATFSRVLVCNVGGTLWG